MKNMWTIAALGVLVALSLNSQTSRADQPQIITAQGSGGCAACQGQGQAPAGQQPKKGAFEKVKGFFNGPSCGCLPNSDISCSNWKQEYQFIFGDCRNFFGNPCFKTPEQLMSISDGEYLGRTNPGINRVNRTYP
jgi:hypothetical protein